MQLIDNPFAVIDRRFNHLESLLLEIKRSNATLHSSDPEAVLTAAQAAEFFQISLPTFREWDKRGLVPRRVIAGEIRYLRSELIASLQEPKVNRVVKRKNAAAK